MTGTPPTTPARLSINQQLRPTSTPGNNNPPTLQHSSSPQHTTSPDATDIRRQSEVAAIRDLSTLDVKHGNSAQNSATLRDPSARLSISQGASKIADDSNGPSAKYSATREGQVTKYPSAKRKRPGDRQEPRIGTNETYAKGIIKPKETDILCGRGGITTYHPGNLHKITILKTLQPKYSISTRKNKWAMCRDVLTQLHKEKRRYLKQDPITKLWDEIPDGDAINKIYHTLRGKIIANDGEKRPTKRARIDEGQECKKHTAKTIEPIVDDILCSRGIDGITNTGNRHKTKVLGKLQEEFLRCNSPKEEMAICEKALDQLHNEGRRFLKRNPQSGSWYELTNAQALQSIKSSFLSKALPRAVMSETSAKLPGANKRIGTSRPYDKDINKLNDKDIIFGKLSNTMMAKQHPGNGHKEKIFNSLQSEYKSATPKERHSIVMRVLQNFHKEGRRLVEQDPDTQLWNEILDEVAYTKIQSGFRIRSAKDHSSNRQAIPTKTDKSTEMGTATGYDHPNRLFPLCGHGCAFPKRPGIFGLKERQNEHYKGFQKEKTDTHTKAYQDSLITVEGQFDDADEDAVVHG